MRRTSIVVADPGPIFRAGVRHLLRLESDFEVFEAATLPELSQTLEERQPDIALIDLELPPSGGVAAVAGLAPLYEARMIIWGFEASSDAVLAAVTAGAKGFLPKEISPAGLIRSLRGVVRGGGAALARPRHAHDRRGTRARRARPGPRARGRPLHPRA